MKDIFSGLLPFLDTLKKYGSVVLKTFFERKMTSRSKKRIVKRTIFQDFSREEKIKPKLSFQKVFPDYSDLLKQETYKLATL